MKVTFAGRWPAVTAFRFLFVPICLAVVACEVPTAPLVSVDGDYRGSATRYQALRRDCPHNTLMLLSVRSNTTFYRWGQQYIQVSVLSNGTLTGSLPGVRLTGTFDGTILQGDVTDGACSYHFTAKRITE